MKLFRTFFKGKKLEDPKVSAIKTEIYQCPQFHQTLVDILEEYTKIIDVKILNCTATDNSFIAEVSFQIGQKKAFLQILELIKKE